MDKIKEIVHLGQWKEQEHFTLHNYYATKITKEEIELLIEHKKLGTLSSLKDKFKGINLDGIHLVGDGHSTTAGLKLRNILQKFHAKKAEDTYLHYRDYQRSLENQKELSHLINICPDPVMSWYSVLRKIGYQVYARNTTLGIRFASNNEHIICNVIIWKTKV